MLMQLRIWRYHRPRMQPRKLRRGVTGSDKLGANRRRLPGAHVSQTLDRIRRRKRPPLTGWTCVEVVRRNLAAQALKRALQQSGEQRLRLCPTRTKVVLLYFGDTTAAIAAF